MQSDSKFVVQQGFEDDFLMAGKLVEPQLNRVSGPDQQLQVQPKIMQVLLCLAAQAGKVVSKEQLFETVWAGLHVSDHVLSRAVSELRKIFGDDPRNPRVIETIPKTGYRLIAEIVKAAPQDPPAEATGAGGNSDAPAAQPTARRRWARPLFLGLVAASLLLVLVSPFLRHQLFHKLFHTLFHSH